VEFFSTTCCLLAGTGDFCFYFFKLFTLLVKLLILRFYSTLDLLFGV